jgi:hypothetical protein
MDYVFQGQGHFVPSEVYKAGPCPYHPATAGATAWAAALQMAAELLARDPHYFK